MDMTAIAMIAMEGGAMVLDQENVEVLLFCASLFDGDVTLL